MQNPLDPQNQPAASQPPVLIVLLNWNSPAETAAAVESVLKMDYDNYHVLLVDNGSTDNSLEVLRQISHPRVKLVEAGMNRGFTGGCNLGLTHALKHGADYVWLLNSDAVTAPTTLSSLVTLAESDPRIGLLSPLILTDDIVPKTSFAGGICLLRSNLLDHTADIAVARQWTADHPAAGVVVGTALLIRTALVRDIGMLDESLFMYYEDTDYSVRSFQAGYRNVVDLSSVVYHPEKSIHADPQAIKPHYWYYMARNERRFWRKHLGFIRSIKPSWWSVRRYLQHRNRVNPATAGGRAILAGLWHGWLGKTGPYHSSYRMPSFIAAVVNRYGKKLAMQDAPQGVPASGSPS